MADAAAWGRLVRFTRSSRSSSVASAADLVDLAKCREQVEQAGRISRDFADGINRRLDFYTGTVDQFGAPRNTVDSWRIHFNRR